MKRLAFAGIFVVAVAVALVIYAYLKPTAEASGPIQAIPIAVATATAAPAVQVDPTTETNVAALPSPTTEEAPEVAVTEATSTEEAAAPTEAAAEAAAPTVFEIQQGASQARYIIDEVLRGNPVTVVGSTDQVAGQIAVDPSNPSATQLGTIQVNARTFATDESRRDSAVQNRILLTNEYEYITFEPTALVGLPESGAVGQSYTFQIVGNLTIRDQSHEVTWDATVTPVSATTLQGSASTTIAYAEWGVSIPSVPFVANVGDQVRLELDFTATAP